MIEVVKHLDHYSLMYQGCTIASGFQTSKEAENNIGEFLRPLPSTIQITSSGEISTGYEGVAMGTRGSMAHNVPAKVVVDGVEIIPEWEGLSAVVHPRVKITVGFFQDLTVEFLNCYSGNWEWAQSCKKKLGIYKGWNKISITIPKSAKSWESVAVKVVK